MTRLLSRLLVALTLAAIPLGPGIIAAPVAAGMQGCWIGRYNTTISSQCEYQVLGGYQYVQTWVKCGPSNYWSKGNRIGPNSYNPVTHAQYHSTYNCWPYEPRVWTMAYWTF